MSTTTAHTHNLTESQTATYAIVSIVLVLSAGVFSGLTLSLFSIDVMQLMVSVRTGEGKELRRAQSLLALIERHHLVLVSLLVSNAACMTALPIFLESLLDPVSSLIVSVTAVLFFGEVIPQATFVRNAIPVSGFFVPVIWLVIGVTFVVSYPVGKLLDLIVGHKSAVLEREQLGEFLRMHAEQPAAALADDMGLSKEEVLVMQGALRMSTQTVGQMKLVGLSDVFMLSSTALLDRATLQLIVNKGFSRVPIYKDDDRRHIMGVLLVKSLLPLAYKSPDPPPTCGEYPLREVVRASVDWTVQGLYEAFQDAQTHMAVVYNNKGKMIGIATLEDVFELLHSTTLDDEYDAQRKYGSKLIEVLGDVRRISQKKSALSLALLKGQSPGSKVPAKNSSANLASSSNNHSFSQTTRSDFSGSAAWRK